MTPTAAFFDLDRTLIWGSSAFTLGMEAWRQGLASNSDMAEWVVSALKFLIIGDKGDVASDQVKADFLTGISGASVEALEELEAVVLPRLLDRVRPESRRLVAMHHDEGRDTWIVSASPHRLVEPLAVSLGMTGAMGTKGEIIDSTYTGRLDGPFLYGVGKVEAIEALVSDRGYDLDRCYAYSDSISDLPMLELVGHPVAVNPDSELESIAHDRGWPVVTFARKAKRAIAFGGVGTGTIVASVIAYFVGRRHGRVGAAAHVSSRRPRRSS